MENGNQPAFGYGFANEQHHLEEKGLTKREYFAAMALQGILANEELRYSLMSNHRTSTSDFAVKQADELFKKLDTTIKELIIKSDKEFLIERKRTKLLFPSVESLYNPITIFDNK